MNKKLINTVIATIFVTSLGLASTNAMAGPDYQQQQIIHSMLQAKQKLQQAEAAKAEERQKLMSEHMQMLHDNMSKCSEMKPKAGMTEKERDEWYAEHQKVMDEIMSQMMEEHHLQVTSASCDSNKK